MPLHDPVPNSREPIKRRFWRIFRLLAVLSIIVATIAVILVSEGDTSLHINMLIATALGVGLTMLLGTSLMTLAFLSAESGHDDAAAAPANHEENE